MILNFTQIGYLNKIRKAIALRYDQTPKSISKELTDEQKEAYVKLLEKRRNMLKKTTASDLKKYDNDPCWGSDLFSLMVFPGKTFVLCG